MRQVRHTFDTVAEANAFVNGVEWVNDGAIECIDIEVGADEKGREVATVVCNDEDGGDIDTEIDYREDPADIRVQENQS